MGPPVPWPSLSAETLKPKAQARRAVCSDRLHTHQWLSGWHSCSSSSLWIHYGCRSLALGLWETNNLFCFFFIFFISLFLFFSGRWQTRDVAKTFNNPRELLSPPFRGASEVTAGIRVTFWQGKVMVLMSHFNIYEWGMRQLQTAYQTTFLTDF